jgi:hypothetical protein
MSRNRLILPIPLPNDLSKWKANHYLEASVITQKVINDEVSEEFKKYFNYESLKIDYNYKTNLIYIFDKNYNFAMNVNDRVELVNPLGEIIKYKPSDIDNYLELLFNS